MDYLLTWTTTMLVLMVSLVVGIGSAMVIRDGAVRTLWAAVVGFLFAAGAAAAVLLGHSWMFSDAARAQAQIVALGAGLTGLIYFMRAPS